MPIHVSLACNDHRNGAFTGRVTRVEIGLGPMDTLMVLDDPYIEQSGLALAFLEGRGRFHQGEAEARMRVAGKQFPVLGRTTWAGSWVYDLVFMRAVWIPPLVELLRRYKWQIDEVETQLFDAYQSGAPIAPVWMDRRELARAEAP